MGSHEGPWTFRKMLRKNQFLGVLSFWLIFVFIFFRQVFVSNCFFRLSQTFLKNAAKRSFFSMMWLAEDISNDGSVFYWNAPSPENTRAFLSKKIFIQIQPVSIHSLRCPRPKYRNQFSVFDAPSYSQFQLQQQQLQLQLLQQQLQQQLQQLQQCSHNNFYYNNCNNFKLSLNYLSPLGNIFVMK